MLAMLARRLARVKLVTAPENGQPRNAPEPWSRGPSALLPYPAVDAFAQEVGVPAVACVLVDPVNPHLPASTASVACSRARSATAPSEAASPAP
jgi:hypothetical protein